MLLVFILGFFAKQIAPYYPLDWEPSIRFDNTHTDDAKQTDYNQVQQSLQNILNTLAPHSNTPEIAYQIHLLDSDIANAFATLGGNIFISRGLLPHIESENGLAMVIAHEMAHIELRHPIQTASQTALYQLVTSLVFGDSSIATLTGQAGQLTLLSFSRNMEHEADETALKTLISAYGHGQGADEFFTSMLDEDRGLEFFNTHPDVDKRIEVLRPKHISTTHTKTPLDDVLLSARTIKDSTAE